MNKLTRIFERMDIEESPITRVEQQKLWSQILNREAVMDFYRTTGTDKAAPCSLLIINDGQDLQKIKFQEILDGLYRKDNVQQLLCVGIYAGERMAEYGVAASADYAGRGARAGLYQKFLAEELLPFIHAFSGIKTFQQKAIAGFSLGGLSALDTVWNHPQIFSIAGIFSGSLWWRSKALEDGYEEDKDRIMHQQIRKGAYKPALGFYFTSGSLDETSDRNNNGIIDSIDDTLALISELERLGYQRGKEIQYKNYEDGRHDVESWGRAMPDFLKWMGGSRNLQVDAING